MSNLFLCFGYILWIGFLPLLYTFLRSLSEASLKDPLFFKLFLKDVVRTFPVCFLVALPLFVFPMWVKAYMLFIHFCFVPLMFIEISHIYLFKTRIGLNTFFTLFVSNMKETKEFMSQNVPMILFVLAPLFLGLPLVFLLSLQPLELSLVQQIIGGIFCGVCAIPFVRNLFKRGFKFKDGYILNPYSNVFYHLYAYHKTYSELKNWVNQKKAPPFQGIVSKVDPKEPETYVIVIGESANRSHLSLYGYPRDTNEFLEKTGEKIYAFKNVISPFAQTLPVLERVLTFMDSEHPEYLYQKGSIVEFFNQAGFKTYWFSNQYALSDTLITAISKQASWEKSFNFSGMKRFEKTGFDGDMLPDFKKVLSDQTVLKKVIFVHLIGSHSAYANRYPASFKYFKEPFPRKNLSKEGHALLNAYDDSIRYTDYVLAQMITMLKSVLGKSFLLYLSDHGEDIFDTDTKKILGHSQLANKPMTEIPFLLWCSQEYIKALQGGEARIESTLEKPYNSQDVIHTILILAQLSHSDVLPQKSLV